MGHVPCGKGGFFFSMTHISSLLQMLGIETEQSSVPQSPAGGDRSEKLSEPGQPLHNLYGSIFMAAMVFHNFIFWTLETELNY